jgi:hypothetical protein
MRVQTTPEVIVNKALIVDNQEIILQSPKSQRAQKNHLKNNPLYQ